MKKVFLIMAMAAGLSLSANAQSFKDTFDSNSLGWTEISGSDGEAVIKEGVLHLEGKKNGTNFYIYTPGSQIISSCYAPFDPKANFEIKCKAIVKKINEKNPIGMMVNYIDDYNFMAFTFDENKVYYRELYEGNLVGYKENLLNLKGKRNAEVNISIRSTENKIEFFINNMRALELRYKPIMTTGIGFYVYGAQVADFDDLEIIQ